MKLSSFRARIVWLIVLALLLGVRPAAAQSGGFGPSYKGAVIGAAVGIAAAVGIGIYLIHRSHTSLTGCVRRADHGLSLTGRDGKSYELVNAPPDVKPGERLALRGHKTKAASGHAFEVGHVSHNYGTCAP